ncbi:MAG: FkbM family methyltransferase [Henriciella sp.]
MKISVVVPVFNVEPSLLAECFKSLKLQSLSNEDYEVILIDDASSDENTLDAIKPDRLPSNFRVVTHEENLGLNEARRTGTKSANGDYVIFVDGDDMLSRDGLELFRMEAHKSKADIVTSWFQRWHLSTRTLSDLLILRRPFASDLSERMAAVFACNHSYTMCGRLFRKELLTDEIFDMRERVYHEDLITLPRAMRNAKKISSVKKTVYYYTENQASITSVFSMKHAQDFFYAFSEWQRLATTIGGDQDFDEPIREGIEKLASTMIRRCRTAENLTEEEKSRTMDFIESKLNSFGVTRHTATFTIVKSLFKLNELKDHTSETEHSERWQDIFSEFDRVREAERPKSGEPKKAISNLALRLKDKIVLIGQVDYQVKNAALAARELRKRGHACVVLDNSEFVAGGKRKFLAKDRAVFWRTEHIKIPKGPYQRDWLATAKAVITYNDFNDDIRDALEYRQLLGMPTICAVEGINDFERIDFRQSEDDPYRFLPYRRCDTVFLAGKNDQRFFEDRDTRVVGMPIVEELRKKKPAFPNKPVAALNLNFTYGVLEDKRDEFLQEALAGIARAGFDYKITQHPMDKGALDNLNVTSSTQYQLIDETSVFVSRFATGILEALASGKPAIYFNPHSERVDKFTKPLGAFEVATNAKELEQALGRVKKDIADGVDFRKRSKKFLAEHTNFKLRGKTVSQQFADAVVDVMEHAEDAPLRMHEIFYERLEKDAPFEREAPFQVYGDFQRRHKAQLNDEEMLARYFDDQCDIMIDVGANFGNSCDVYLGKGWTVHAFEPDPYNRSKLLEVWPNDKKLIVNEEAVDDKGGQELSFFASDESTGISGLSAFTEGHKEVCKVQTTTLRDYYKSAGLSHVDFLKIDVEGFDKFVLDGFPWEADRPEVVLAEFEDNKTVPLGYTIHDLAKVMESNGYTVYVSEWHPIIRYGIAHDWRRFLKYDQSLNLKETWGNLIGFKTDPGMDVLRDLVRDTMKFSVALDLVKKPPAKGAATTGKVAAQTKVTAPQAAAPVPIAASIRVEKPWYADFGNRLREASPKVFGVAQIARRLVAGLWRRKFLMLPLAAIVAGLLILSNAGPLSFVQSPIVLLAGVLAAVSGIGYLGYISYINFRTVTAQLHRLTIDFEDAKSIAKRTHKVQQEIFSMELTVKNIEGELTRTKAELARTRNGVDSLTILNGKLEQQVQDLATSHESETAALKAQFVTSLAGLGDRFTETETKITESETKTLALTEVTKNLSSAVEDAKQVQTGFDEKANAFDQRFDSMSSSIKGLTGRALELERQSRQSETRANAIDRQIGEAKYPDASGSLAFFGHHKCGSRFFREEVFKRIAETRNAEIIRYKVENPPYHYSQLDELDLGNIDLSVLDDGEQKVVLFANGSPRSIAAMDVYKKDWRGIRVIRDPRQVLVSGYFHHKGDHPAAPNWVWDQLVEDKPILQSLSEEDGILHELESISKQVIEEHILADFSDERVLTIKLEEFSEAPKEHLAKIADFLRLADLQGMNLERTFAYKESRPWQNVFTSKIRKAFKDKYGEALIELGYEKDLFW